jgi:hypothetical protein
MAGFKINCSNVSTILLVVILVLVVVCILTKSSVESFRRRGRRGNNKLKKEFKQCNLDHDKGKDRRLCKKKLKINYKKNQNQQTQTPKEQEKRLKEGIVKYHQDIKKKADVSVEVAQRQLEEAKFKAASAAANESKVREMISNKPTKVKNNINNQCLYNNKQVQEWKTNYINKIKKCRLDGGEKKQLERWKINIEKCDNEWEGEAHNSSNCNNASGNVSGNNVSGNSVSGNRRKGWWRRRVNTGEEYLMHRDKPNNQHNKQENGMYKKKQKKHNNNQPVPTTFYVNNQYNPNPSLVRGINNNVYENGGSE